MLNQPFPDGKAGARNDGAGAWNAALPGMLGRGHYPRGKARWRNDQVLAECTLAPAASVTDIVGEIGTVPERGARIRIAAVALAPGAGLHRVQA